MISLFESVLQSHQQQRRFVAIQFGMKKSKVNAIYTLNDNQYTFFPLTGVTEGCKKVCV